ncbi:MAG: NADH-quinone oxidoreductase subunit M, partial [Candidatus Eisenbacteria bacterium]|nr:NADH-quinone oxidoreductase subunit M [Candidatus Eisenbacteria bacterium]
MSESHILAWIIFLPLAGAGLLMFYPKDQEEAIRRTALLVALVVAGFCVPLLTGFQSVANLQYVEKLSWIPAWGVEYHVGLDGISLFLVLLTAFLIPLAILASWGDIRERVKEFHIFFLILETGIMGALLSMDLFLFYIFWELMLIPMYFIIGVWGGGRRVYAALKFVLYTIFGSLLMLVAILWVVLSHQAETGRMTFNLLILYEHQLPHAAQWWCFLAFGLAFAIKVPIFPFHTWLPDAHTEAPTAGSVILAGVLLKMGTYGFLRFAMPLFPQAALAAQPYILVLAVVGIIYGALVAMMQDDVKRLVAYSSVSHLGFVMLGLFSLNIEAFQGSLYQMLNHGLSTGALFLLVGMIYGRRHTRLIADYGGLARTVPLFAASFLFITLSSIGLPGLNGFVGEFLILLGAFGSKMWTAILGGLGVVLGAFYMLWLCQRFLFGPVTHAENKGLRDLNLREGLTLIPIFFLVIYMGVSPKPLLDRMEPSLIKALDRMTAHMEPLPVEHSPQMHSWMEPASEASPP